MGEEGEDFLVLLECGIVHLNGEGVVIEFHERGEGVAVPQVDRVHAVVDEHVEIVYPLLLVIEPREELWRVRILIDHASGQEIRLLHADTSATEHHLRCVGDLLREVHDAF